MYVRKCKVAVKMRRMVLKMHITCKQKCDQNVYELRIAEFTLFSLKISLGFKWFIISSDQL